MIQNNETIITILDKEEEKYIEEPNKIESKTNNKS